MNHVCSEFTNFHRSVENFVSADYLVMDCDNDHSENPKDWIYPKDYADMFPDVAYIVATSRNDMKVKDGKSARPRHHIYFPHDVIINQNYYKVLKKAYLKNIRSLMKTP